MLPCLYRHLRLDCISLRRLVQYCSRESGVTGLTYVRCLTLELQPQPPERDEQQDQILQDGNRTTHKFWIALRTMKNVLRYTNHLSVFSIFQDRCADNAMGYWIPHESIIDVIQALPQCCTHLEIDCDGLDRPHLRRGHLCDSVRQLVPRLQSLRLRLAALCPSIFIPSYSFQESPDQERLQSQLSGAVPVPSLISLILNCSLNWHSDSVVCERLHRCYSNLVPTAFTSRLALAKITRQL